MRNQNFLKDHSKKDYTNLVDKKTAKEDDK